MTIAAERRLLGRITLPWPESVESAEPDVPARPGRWVMLSAGAIPVVLTAAWLVAGRLQPPTYSPVRQTVSVLSGHAGTDRWIVTAALYAVGVAYLVTAAGMRGMSAAGRAGLVVAGAAAIGVASFPEPVHGTSREHAICTAIGAITITVWPALVARQDAVLAVVGARRSLAAIAISAGLFLWTAAETRNGSMLGLAERVSSGLQATWPFVVAVLLRRAQLQTSADADGERSVAGVLR